MLEERLVAACQGVVDWGNRRRWILFSVFTLLHFTASWNIARRKLLWFDELFTYALSRLPSVAALHAELEKGVDHHPLPYFLLMRFFGQLTENPNIGYRLPSMIGIWLAGLAVFLFLSKRTSAITGLTGAFLLYSTGVVRYSAEARPYGLTIGFIAVAACCWQRTEESRHRNLYLAGLAMAIGAALWTSYYAILILVPLGAAQLTRSFRLQRLDLGVWLSMLAGAAACLPFVPVVLHSVASFHAQNWAKPRLGSSFEIYGRLFFETHLFWLGFLLAGSLILWRQWGNGGKLPLASWPPEEIVLALALLALPLIGQAVAMLATKMIHERYVLSTVIGFCILAPLLLYRFCGGSALAQLVLLAGTLLPGFYFYRQNQYFARQVSEQLATLEKLVSGLPTAQTGALPIVFDDFQLCTQARHHLSEKTASRFVLLTDPDASLKYGGFRYSGRGLFQLQRYSSAKVEDHRQFRRSHTSFIFIDSNPHYLMAVLLEEKAKLQFLGKAGALTAYLVEDR